MTVRRLTFLSLSLSAALLTSAARADIPVVKTEDGQLNVGAMMQALGFGQRVNDPTADHNRAYLFIKEARFRANGNYQDFTFNAELALGGEDAIAATTGVSLGLLDLSVNLPLRFVNPQSYLKVGQFKVPYGRERLTYSGNAQFIDRSIQDLGFRVGRDVGAALTLQSGLFTVIAGVFTGGGRDVPPQHYLPERLGIPQVVARLGVGNIDGDAYALADEPFATSTKAAFFVNGIYTKDSTVGHSSVLNVKLIDKSILLNSNWNPYIAKGPLAQGEWWQLGADAALRTPIGGGASLSAEAEVNWAGYSNTYGVVHSSGGRVQAGVGLRPFEVALRYAVLFPDANFASGGHRATGTQALQEITPSATYFLEGRRLKLVAELPVLINTPVVTENKVGSYVGVELPDQLGLLAKGGTVGRQTVVEARLMLQASF